MIEVCITRGKSNLARQSERYRCRDRIRTYETRGRVDLECATVVTGGIASLPGVASTSTVIAFRSYSSADLGEV